MSRKNIAILLFLLGLSPLIGCAREKALPKATAVSRMSLWIGVIPPEGIIFRQIWIDEPLPEGQKVLEKFGALMFIETADKDYTVVVKCAEDVNTNIAYVN